MPGAAIIFDLDGTLWDATGIAARIWNGVFERRGLSLRLTPEDVRRQMGRTMDEIGAAFFPDLPAAEQRAIMEQLGVQEIVRMHEGGAVLYPGAEEALRALSASHPLFIVSNCQRDYVRAFIRTQRFEAYFTDYEESGRTGQGKAENIRRVLGRNGIRSAVYVGDTRGDEDAAREAGIPFIHARYGFGSAIRPDRAIDDLRELPGIMASFGEPIRRDRHAGEGVPG